MLNGRTIVVVMPADALITSGVYDAALGSCCRYRGPERIIDPEETSLEAR